MILNSLGSDLIFFILIYTIVHFCTFKLKPIAPAVNFYVIVVSCFLWMTGEIMFYMFTFCIICC